MMCVACLVNGCLIANDSWTNILVQTYHYLVMCSKFTFKMSFKIEVENVILTGWIPIY